MKKERHKVADWLHLGAGVQSSMLAELYIEKGLPGIDKLTGVIFADTGNEPPWVYKQVDYLRERLKTVDTPLHVVRTKNSDGIVNDITGGINRFVSMPLWTMNLRTGKVSKLRRQCTSEYKIVPSDDFVKDWLIANGHGKIVTDKNGQQYRRVSNQVYVNNIFGISLDEFERSCRAKRSPQWKHDDYPLIHPLKLRRSDCIAWLQKHGLRVPKKSSCIVCPFHEDGFWLDLQQNHPHIFQEAIVFDNWLRAPDGEKRQSLRQATYLHRSCKPLSEINFEVRVATKQAWNEEQFNCHYCET